MQRWAGRPIWLRSAEASVERWTPPFCGIRTSGICWLGNQSVGSPVPRQKKRAGDVLGCRLLQPLWDRHWGGPGRWCFRPPALVCVCVCVCVRRGGGSREAGRSLCWGGGGGGRSAGGYCRACVGVVASRACGALYFLRQGDPPARDIAPTRPDRGRAPKSLKDGCRYARA